MAHFHKKGLGLVHQSEGAQSIEKGQPTQQAKPQQAQQADTER
jgi:hypothetical protein